MLLTHAFSSFHIKPLHSSYIPISSCSSSSPTRRRLVRTTTTRKSNLKTLTSRIVQLTRRKQLRQIFNEIEVAKKHFWKLNTIVMNAVMEACVRCGDVESAIRIFEEMKCPEACGVDTVTYAILLKGCGQANDLVSVVQIVLEMKSRSELYIDRTAYTATVDALLKCGSFKGALCIFGEVQKQVDLKPELRPKSHLYLSLMRAFALRGDYHLVKNLHKRILPDTAGTILPVAQEEADHLLMEAALNAGQVDVAIKNLTYIVSRWKGICWTSHGGMVASRIEALLGFSASLFNPFLLPQVSPSEPVEGFMIPFEATRPLQGTVKLKNVVTRFFNDAVVPIVDEWGSCTGLLHREDCNQLDASLSTMMRSPPPSVTASTSVGHVIDLILEKGYPMVIIVNCTDVYATSYGCRAVGVFTLEQLIRLIKPVSEGKGTNLSLCRR